MTSSANKGRLHPDALFGEEEATGEGTATEDGGTQVFGGLVSVEGHLVVESGRHAGESAALGAGTCYLGRSSKCALVLRRTAGVSRRHAKIQYADGHYEISDCGSRNGTRVNGQRIGEGFPLNDGDVVQISDERMRFTGPSGREEATALSGSLLASDEPTGSVAAKPRVHQPTQRVRVRSPDSLLHTEDGGQAAASPAPARATHQPLLQSLPHVEPSAETAFLPGYVPGYGGPPPPLPFDDAPYVHQAGPRELRKGPLLLLGLLLGALVLGGGLFVWDAQLEGGLLAELFSDEPPEEPSERAEEEAAAVPEPAARDPEPALAEAAPEPPEPEPAPAVVEEPPAPPPPAASKKEPLAVRSPSGGRVAEVAATEGQAVQKGELLLTLERPSPNAARKLRALRREERLFAEHAAGGNARAKQDLEQVRGEMRRLQRRKVSVKVQAPTAGVVDEVLVRPGGSVRAKAPLLKLTPD